MTFRVKKPFDEYFNRLSTTSSVKVDDKSAGLYFLRLSKCFGVQNIQMDRVRHNRWVMRKTRPFVRKTSLAKYTVFE